MKTFLIVFAVWVFTVPCMVSLVLICMSLVFLLHSLYGIAVFFGLLLTLAALLATILDFPLFRGSSFRRTLAVLKPNLIQENTHENSLDPHLGS